MADLRRVDGSSVCPSTKLLTFTRDLTTASGTQALTGFGFRPKRCTGWGAVDLTNAVYTTLIGKVDDAGNMSALFYYTATQLQNSTASFLNPASGANNASAVLSSYDADGLTLYWTKNASPTGIFKFTVECSR